MSRYGCQGDGVPMAASRYRASNMTNTTKLASFPWDVRPGKGGAWAVRVRTTSWCVRTVRVRVRVSRCECGCGCVCVWACACVRVV